MRHARLWATFCLGLVFALITACAGERPPIARIQISASAELNPDASGRASPIVLRIYGLRSADAFNNARFFEIFENDTDTLGIGLVNQYEFEIFPGDVREIGDLTFGMDVRYLGFLAAYRDLDNASWRALSEVVIGEAIRINVSLDRLQLSIDNN